MDSDNPQGGDRSSGWRKSHFEDLEAFKQDVAQSRRFGRRILDALPESDRQYLIAQIAAVMDLQGDKGGKSDDDNAGMPTDAVLECQAVGGTVSQNAGGYAPSLKASRNVTINVLHSSPVELQTDGGTSRLRQLEMQLESCLESLERSEEALLESEIRVHQLTEELSEMVFSRAWKFTSLLNDTRLRLAPRGSRREKAVKKALSIMLQSLRTLRHPPVRQLQARFLGFLKAHAPQMLKRFINRHRSWGADYLPERLREHLRVTMDLAENLRSPLWDRFDEFLNTEAANHLSGRFFVIFSGTTFTESEGQRPTRLARELARRGVPVLFCYWRWNDSEPPHAREFPHVFCLPIDELLKNFDSLLGDARLAGLKRAFLMEFPHPALWEAVNYANALGWKTIYDVIDDWEEFHACGQAHWYDCNFERYLINNADLSTFTCKKLLDKLAAEAPERCRLLPNAYEDWVELKNAERREAAKGNDKAGKTPGKITVGYFGHLTSSWFDWPLIVGMAKRHPEWTFQIIGYGMDTKVESLPNIVFLGKVERSRLPTCAKSWDVAMIPFKPSRLSEAVDPIKIYEYIALELPTVVTGMPHLASYPGVFTAETAEQFEEAVRTAAAHPLDEITVRGFLDENRWANRIDELLELIDQHENCSVVSLALADNLL